MVLVDTCVWIDLFGGRSTAETEILESLLDEERVLVGDFMAIEVLKGIKSEAFFNSVLAKFEQLSVVEISDYATAIAGARFHRKLRERGITPRKTVDTLIAARCIADRIPFLTSDRDFLPFAAHFGLILYGAPKAYAALNEPAPNAMA
jgi:predicted nucleic acid-binding protein